MLSAPAGPLLILEGRTVKYEWTVPRDGTPESGPSSGTLELHFVFKDPSGTRLGGVTVSATQTGSSPRQAMERAERKVAASLAKFIRKSVVRNPEAEPAEPPGATP